MNSVAHITSEPELMECRNTRNSGHSLIPRIAVQTNSATNCNKLEGKPNPGRHFERVVAKRELSHRRSISREYAISYTSVLQEISPCGRNDGVVLLPRVCSGRYFKPKTATSATKTGNTTRLLKMQVIDNQSIVFGGTAAKGPTNEIHDKYGNKSYQRIVESLMQLYKDMWHNRQNINDL